MKVTDGNDPSRREEENNSNGSINGRISPNGQMNNGHVLTNSDSDNESAGDNNAEHSGYELLPQNDPSRPPNATADPESGNNDEDNMQCEFLMGLHIKSISYMYDSIPNKKRAY